jgi:hypothetical protein
MLGNQSFPVARTKRRVKKNESSSTADSRKSQRIFAICTLAPTPRSARTMPSGLREPPENFIASLKIFVIR